MNLRVAWLLVGIGTLGHTFDAGGQTRTAREVYQFACAACHGSNGSGAPTVESGYPLAPPDFSDCNFSTREPGVDRHRQHARRFTSYYDQVAAESALSLTRATRTVN
jgi:hypothetical protein